VQIESNPIFFVRITGHLGFAIQPDDSQDFKKSKQDTNTALDHIRAILTHQILLLVLLAPEECYRVYPVVSLSRTYTKKTFIERASQALPVCRAFLDQDFSPTWPAKKQAAK
jgi:hypothetical protein